MGKLPDPPPSRDTDATRAPRPQMNSRAFWDAVDRLQRPDADALGVIDYPGKIGASGKRPGFG
jgi:hypothetical protein